MAPSAITQSLAALLPTYANKFPPQLTHLAESLLAQSHQRASHLKPEEEIARAYACSEIACKRLRAQCRLPAAKSSSAPCKPTVYKKLVTFLQRVLDEESALQQQTPKSTPGGGRKRTADGQVKNNKINPAAAVGSSEPSTPSKTKTGRNNNTPNRGFVGKIKASSAGKSRPSENNEAPSWLMPSIRKVCRLFSTPLLAPHVYTGTCVILRLAGMWPRPEDAADNLEDEQEFKQNVTGLMVALYLMTLTRMKTGKMTTTVYKSTCSRAVAEIEYSAGTEGVEAWIRRINREGYCGQQDWWVSVPEAVFAFDPSKTACMVDDDDDDDDKEDAIEDDDVLVSRQRRWRPGRSAAAAGDEDDEDEEDPNGVLLPGLHTMMQDAVVFLSEERTREYEAWKKALLRKLDRLDKVPADKEARALAVH